MLERRGLSNDKPSTKRRSHPLWGRRRWGRWCRWSFGDGIRFTSPTPLRGAGSTRRGVIPTLAPLQGDRAWLDGWARTLTIAGIALHQCGRVNATNWSSSRPGRTPCRLVHNPAEGGVVCTSRVGLVNAPPFATRPHGVAVGALPHGASRERGLRHYPITVHMRRAGDERSDSSRSHFHSTNRGDS